MNRDIEAQGRRWRLQVRHEPYQEYVIQDVATNNYVGVGQYPRSTTVSLRADSDDLHPQLYQATAVCHPNDQFSRRKGREIASERLRRRLKAAGWTDAELRRVHLAIMPEHDPVYAPWRAMREAQRILRRHGLVAEIYMRAHRPDLDDPAHGLSD